MTASLPSGTVTFLFTDLEGSTQLWERHPAAMRAALARHDARLRQAIEVAGGHVVKTTGDGCHAVFATAHDGLAAALAAQLALAAEAWDEIKPDALRVRMALHTGEVEMRAGDYYGGAVNRAARLMAVAHAGQVLLSAVTAGLTAEQMPPGTSLRDLGEHRLKDLTQPEHVFQLVGPGLQAVFPPLRSAGASLNNLPVQLTSFIGRERELAEVRNLLAGTRLLTLTGPGGTGKTRLALQAAAEVLAHVGAEGLPAFAGGVWLVELAPLADPALLVQTVAAAFDLRPPPGIVPRDALTDYLRAKQLLLLLDNCEHLVEACAQLADHLLRACPRLKIMASSREALGIAGETAYRVPSLACPNPRTADPHTLVQSEAARLFVDRALAAQPRLTLTAQNVTAIAQICGRLDGIPLALELAAARTRVFTPEQVATRLDDRFRLLTGGSRTALPRQQTLRALIDWSYDLLPEPERALLRRLSVFAGGWSLEAAEAIAKDEGGRLPAGDEEVQPDLFHPPQGSFLLQPSAVLDLLSRLVDKSLVVVDDSEPGGEARYHLLETIRQYARDRLLDAERGESPRVRDRHLDYFVRLSEEAEAGLRGDEIKAWHDRLTLEQENIRAALAWGLDQRPEEALAIAGNLTFYWIRDWGLAEGREWVEKALERTAALPTAEGPAAARRLLRQARGFTGASFFAANLGFPLEAQPLSAEAIAAARACGNRMALAYALTSLSAVSGNTPGGGTLSGGRAAAQEALALARELGDQPLLAMVLVLLTLLCGQQGDQAARQQYAGELRQFLGRTRLPVTGMPVFLVMGMEARMQGDLDAARAYLNEAMRAYRQLNAAHLVQAAHSELAHVARQAGDLAQARHLYEQNLPRWVDLGNRPAIAHELECLAFIARAQAAPERAARLFGAAEALREAIGAPMAAHERSEYEREVAALRALWPAPEREAAWAAGRVLTLDEAVAYGLNEDAGSGLEDRQDP